MREAKAARTREKWLKQLRAGKGKGEGRDEGRRRWGREGVGGEDGGYKEGS